MVTALRLDSRSGKVRTFPVQNLLPPPLSAPLRLCQLVQYFLLVRVKSCFEVFVWLIFAREYENIVIYAVWLLYIITCSRCEFNQLGPQDITTPWCTNSPLVELGVIDNMYNCNWADHIYIYIYCEVGTDFGREILAFNMNQFFIF